MRKLTCPPDSEFLGLNVIAFVNNLQEKEVRPIVEKYGLADVDPHQWYPTPKWMAALNEIAQNPNVTANMVAIGMAIGKITPTPPDLENPTLGQVLTNWNNMYQGLHRNGDVGSIVAEKVSETHYKITLTDIYPDDFSYGIMYGYAHRFLPPEADFIIYYDPQIKPRDRGGEDVTVIHVEW